MVSGISFGGLASGLDTETMITQLMQLERQPILRFQQRQADLERVDKSWGDIVLRVSGLRTSLDKVSDRAGWDGFVKATSSNEVAVAATANDGAEPSKLSFTVDRLATRHQVVAGTEGGHASRDALVGAGTFTLTDADGDELTTIATDANTTLADLARQIDEAGVGVDAQVITIGPDDVRLVLESAGTGAASQFTVSSDLTGMAAVSVTTTGVDAQLSMGGLTLTRESNTITDLVDGVTVELRATTATPVTIEASRDTGAAADAVEKFITSANDLLGIVKTTTGYRGTEEAAGALMGDPLARSMGNRLRSLLSEGVPGGTIEHGSQIGMSLTREGRVELDRAKLETALHDDFDGVMEFLAGVGTAGEPGHRAGLVDGVDSWLESIEGSAGAIAAARDSLTGQIDDYDDRILAFEQRLELREETLRRQFVGLETALSQMQAQGNWLAGQLSGLSANSASSQG